MTYHLDDLAIEMMRRTLTDRAEHAKQAHEATPAYDLWGRGWWAGTARANESALELLQEMQELVKRQPLLPGGS